MAKITSFYGIWETATSRVTLHWTLSDVVGIGKVEVQSDRNAFVACQANTVTYEFQLTPRSRGEFTLRVTDDKGPVSKIAKIHKEASLEHPAFVNTGYDWLTYETVLNKPQFRKTNQLRRVGLYAVDMANLQLWIRSDMPPDSFNALCAAFFPDHTPAEIRNLSEASWWWKLDAQRSTFESLKARQAPYYSDGGPQPPESDAPAWLPRSIAQTAASRDVLRLVVPRYAVLPYNFWDNDPTSRSIGTEGSGVLHPVPMIQVKRDPGDDRSWAMWRTASRSCVMKVGRVKDVRAPWPRMDWKDWAFYAAQEQRYAFKNKNKDSPIYTNDAFRTEVSQAAHLQLASVDHHFFGVKTGVAFVGVARQDEKQIIGQGGEWLCGSMRSDTIQSMRQLAMARGKPPQDDIVIQTEVMMLMERTMSPAMALEKFGMGGQEPGVDGVALRDLTVLDKEKFYIPPLSIPFIGTDMCTLTQEFASIRDPHWCGFWERNWAEALGQAKALFLVQYGMQHANPNVQNYLLEFSTSPQEAFNGFVAGTAGKQVRVVIRDVADALLVRQVAWALFGPPEDCPQEVARGVTAADAAKLATMALPILRYNFRTKDQAQENETGSTNEQFGPPGVQFLWNRFSGFYVGSKPSKNDECPPHLLAEALQLTSRWGIAHSAAYVRTVEKALGVEFGNIRWDEVYDENHRPDRYTTQRNGKLPSKEDWEAYSQVDVAWEEAAAKHIHDFLNKESGRAKICEYHNRGWVDAKATFGIRLVDDQNTPSALRVVYCGARERDVIRGTRITDSNGEIPFFDKAYADYAFWIAELPLSKSIDANGSERQIADRIPLEQVGVDGNIFVVRPQPAQAAAITRVVVSGSNEPVSGPAWQIKADVTAAPGKPVTAVRFLLAGVPLATVNSSPYESTLDTTTRKNGKYELTAEATDSGGTTVTSRPLLIEVANAPPEVKITAPPPGDFAGDVVFMAEATAGAGMTMKQVQFCVQPSQKVGSEIPAQPGNAVFSTTLRAADFRNGVARIVAIAEDTAGNIAESAPVEMTVNAAPPTVAITTPVHDAIVAGTFTLTADAQPGAGMALQSVQFKSGNIELGNVPAPDPGVYTIDVDALTLKNGQHQLTAIATDTSGNATTSAPVRITVGNSPPTIAILSPQEGLVGTHIVVVVDAQAGAGMTLKNVQVALDGDAGERTVRMPPAAPYVSDQIELDAGVEYLITANATDTAGNVVAKKVKVVAQQR